MVYDYALYIYVSVVTHWFIFFKKSLTIYSFTLFAEFQQFNVSEVDPSLLSELANDRGHSMSFLNSKRQIEVDENGLRWFVCIRCDRRYKRSQHLSRHLYQCTQTRAFACEFCSYICYRSDVLKNHIKCIHKLAL